MTTKTDIAAKIAITYGIPQARAEAITGSVFSEIADAVKGGEVRVAGFGIFAVKTSPARTGRNPRTGEPIEIGETRAVKFRASKGLNGGLG